MVQRVIEDGYRVEGLYLGTNDPGINIARIEKRVLANTGHRVDPKRIPTRLESPLSNLRRTADQFDSLRLFDISAEHDTAILEPPEQCELQRGNVMWKVDEPAT